MACHRTGLCGAENFFSGSYGHHLAPLWRCEAGGAIYKRLTLLTYLLACQENIRGKHSGRRKALHDLHVHSLRLLADRERCPCRRGRPQHISRRPQGMFTSAKLFTVQRLGLSSQQVRRKGVNTTADNGSQNLLTPTSDITSRHRPLLPRHLCHHSAFINSPLSSFRNIKTASLIDAF